MKKLFAILTVLALLSGLTACDGKNNEATTAISYDDAVLLAATEYYDAIIDWDAARLKNAMSAIFAKRLELADPFADLPAEEKAANEAEYGIDFSDPDAFYSYFAVLMTDSGNITGIRVLKVINYEKLPAAEITELKDKLAEEGISDIGITDYSTAEIEILITYADGTTETDNQYISFVKENGEWKVFPET